MRRPRNRQMIEEEESIPELEEEVRREVHVQAEEGEVQEEEEEVQT